MPVHRHKKDITPTPPDPTHEQSIPSLPDQQTFREYLRELARGAIRVVVEDVMREELDALVGVGWGESSPKRKGYRNGHYTRDLVTSTGRIEDIQVPETGKATSIPKCLTGIVATNPTLWKDSPRCLSQARVPTR